MIYEEIYFIIDNLIYRKAYIIKSRINLLKNNKNKK